LVGELIYPGIGIGIAAGLAILFFLFVQFLRVNTSSDDLPKKVKYNFYLLREQYKELLLSARADLTRSEESSAFKMKMKLILSAQKTTMRGLNFFPGNQEGEKLLFEIAQKKKEAIVEKCGLMRKEIDERKSSCIPRKFQNHTLRVLSQIKKMQKAFPHANLWKDFYFEIFLEYVGAKLTFYIKDANLAALKHNYKIAAKLYMAALQHIKALEPKQREAFKPLEARLEKVQERISRNIKRVNLKSNRVQEKKAA